MIKLIVNAALLLVVIPFSLFVCGLIGKASVVGCWCCVEHVGMERYRLACVNRRFS